MLHCCLTMICASLSETMPKIKTSKFLSLQKPRPSKTLFVSKTKESGFFDKLQLYLKILPISITVFWLFPLHLSCVFAPSHNLTLQTDDFFVSTMVSCIVWPMTLLLANEVSKVCAHCAADQTETN